MQPFAVVIALLLMAAAGWLLSRWARSLLRRHGVPTDESDVPTVSRPVWLEGGDADAADGDAGGRAGVAGEPPEGSRAI